MDRIAGRVIAATSDEYLVDTGGELLRCTLRGTLWQDRGKEDASLVVVGDEVRVEPGPAGQGAIEEVLPRRNALGRGREFQAYGGKGARQRRSRHAVRRRSDQVIAANVDQALLVFAAAQPRLNLSQVDQLIIASLSEDLPTILCVNKLDLTEDDLHESLKPYELVPVEVRTACAITGLGLDAIRERLHGRTTVVWGPSGVGKSTLINTLWPHVDLKVGHVSAMTGMGTHTTRSAAMFRTGDDTWVVDTPGWRHFTPRSLSRDAIDAVLRDVAKQAARCRFSDCRHDQEPGCAVRGALEEGRLDVRRVNLYRELTGMLER